MRDTLTGLGIIALALTIPAAIALALTTTGTADLAEAIFVGTYAVVFYAVILTGIIGFAVAMARRAQRS